MHIKDNVLTKNNRKATTSKLKPKFVQKVTLKFYFITKNHVIHYLFFILAGLKI